MTANMRQAIEDASSQPIERLDFRWGEAETLEAQRSEAEREPSLVEGNRSGVAKSVDGEWVAEDGWAPDVAGALGCPRTLLAAALEPPRPGESRGL